MSMQLHDLTELYGENQEELLDEILEIRTWIRHLNEKPEEKWSASELYQYESKVDRLVLLRIAQKAAERKSIIGNGRP